MRFTSGADFLNALNRRFFQPVAGSSSVAVEVANVNQISSHDIDLEARVILSVNFEAGGSFFDNSVNFITAIDVTWTEFADYFIKKQ